MTKQQILEKRIEALEKEIAKLKSLAVQHHHYHYGPSPNTLQQYVYPQLPTVWCAAGNSQAYSINPNGTEWLSK